MGIEFSCASGNVPAGDRRRFGPLVAAYALAGYQPEPYQRRAETTAKYRERMIGMADDVAARINALGGVAVHERKSGIVCLGDGCRIAVGSARAVTSGADLAQACRYETLDAFCRLCAGHDERRVA